MLAIIIVAFSPVHAKEPSKAVVVGNLSLSVRVQPIANGQTPDIHVFRVNVVGDLTFDHADK